jgi:hypothetical protein
MAEIMTTASQATENIITQKRTDYPSSTYAW